MNVIILRKDRTVLTKRANSKKRDFNFNKSLYILTPDRIHSYETANGNIMNAEIIFFEDNPNGISGEKDPEDQSSKYLDDVVIVNFIQQATDTFGKWEFPSIPFIGWLFEKPQRIPIVIMFGWIAWILIQNAITGGLLG